MSTKKKRNPHMSMQAIDPPRSYPPQEWQCNYCGQRGLYEALRDRECTYVYPPCPTCGQTPECAPDCAAVLDALYNTPGVRVISGRED